MLEENIINSLWVGTALSELEELTIQSFISNGHVFRLWCYAEIKNLPAQVIVGNANDILPQSQVFKYPDNSTIDWGAGSYAGFSDVFRYKLLYERGGWWVDMDVTCLKPFNITEPYFFRNHWKYPVVGNVLKCPAKTDLMKWCYETSIYAITAENKNWHRPIEILNDGILKFDLLSYRQIGRFNLDLIHCVKFFFKGNYPIPIDWYGIHWINSGSTLKYVKKSTFDLLLNKYGVDRRRHRKWFVGW